MDWHTLLDYRLEDLIMFSPEVYEALHNSYLQQYAFMKWLFLLLLLVQVIWLMHHRVFLQLSLALVWAWLAYQYMYQTLGQVILGTGMVAGLLAIQTCIHLVLALTNSLQPRLVSFDGTRDVLVRIGLVLAGFVPWQAIITGQSSLSMSYGQGILPTAMVTIGFAQLVYNGWCRWLTIPIPAISILVIFILLYGLY